MLTKSPVTLARDTDEPLALELAEFLPGPAEKLGVTADAMFDIPLAAIVPGLEVSVITTVPDVARRFPTAGVVLDSGICPTSACTLGLRLSKTERGLTVVAESMNRNV